MDRFFDYLRDTRGELANVRWPTKKQTIIYTALVISVSIIVAIFLGIFDYLFNTGLDLFLK